MQRAQNTHAYVNAGFLFSVDKNDEFRVLHKPRIVYGGIRSDFVSYHELITSARIYKIAMS